MRLPVGILVSGTIQANKAGRAALARVLVNSWSGLVRVSNGSKEESFGGTQKNLSTMFANRARFSATR